MTWLVDETFLDRDIACKLQFLRDDTADLEIWELFADTKLWNFWKTGIGLTKLEITAAFQAPRF